MFYYLFLQGRRGPEGEDGRQVNISMNFYITVLRFTITSLPLTKCVQSEFNSVFNKNISCQILQIERNTKVCHDANVKQDQEASF